MVPPEPRKLALPTFKFLADLNSAARNIETAPIWLKILRAIALFAIVGAIAGPYYSYQKKATNSLEAVTIIIDDGWSNANDWQQIRDRANAIIEMHAPINAETTQFRIILTSQKAELPISVLTKHDALDFIAQTAPRPYLPNHQACATRLEKLNQKSHIYYFSDGINHQSSGKFLEVLSHIALGKPKIALPATPLVAITAVRATNDGYRFTYKSLGTDKPIAVNFLSNDGEILGVGNGRDGIGIVNLPNNLLSKVSAAKISNQHNTGAIHLLAGNSIRPLIGIEALNQTEEPLISDKHYIETAANLIGNVTQADITSLINSKPNAIVFGDRSGFSPSEERALLAFMRHGGTIIRFMGARAIGKQGDLIVSAPLSAEPRIMASNFSWNEAKIAAILPESPLFGIEINDEARPRVVSVFQNFQSNVEIWARLNDQTPLVSQRAIGLGQIVMIHTSASPVWSDISLFDSQVQILRRILQTSISNGVSAEIRPPQGEMRPVLLLNGFGENQEFSSSQKPILPNNLITTPDADFPPGLYAGNGSVHILQAASEALSLSPLQYSSRGFETISNIGKSVFDFRFVFLLIGFLALAIDCIIIAIGLRAKAKPSFKQAGFTFILLSLLFLSVSSSVSTSAQAQNFAAPKASKTKSILNDDDFVMAYIETPDATTNQSARAGLEGLSAAINARTNIRTSRIVAVNPSSDELALYPIIYWLLPANNRPLDVVGSRALNQYMRNGGVLFIDTRGAGRERNAALDNTRTATNGLVLPQIEIPPSGHVLRRTFYLLSGFPGRYNASNLWVETQRSSNISANDGVSPIIIGDGDWASVWAGGPHAGAQAAVEGGDLRREVAFRVGINIYLYALTGQYKADQIHVRAILGRQKQNSPRARPN